MKIDGIIQEKNLSLYMYALDVDVELGILGFYEFRFYAEFLIGFELVFEFGDFRVSNFSDF